MRTGFFEGRCRLAFVLKFTATLSVCFLSLVAWAPATEPCRRCTSARAEESAAGRQAALFPGSGDRSSLGAVPVTLHLDTAVYDTSSVPFVPHTGKGHFGSYLVQNVPYAPVRSLWKQLEKALGRRLKNRGEAHVTVVTPPEFDRILRRRISIRTINELAREMNIQKARFDVICLGSGEADIHGHKEQTYYLVLSSNDLIAIRRRIASAFVAAGGSPGAFEAEHFFPHITVGFTARDLHESDGVIKDDSSFDPRFRLIMEP